MSTKGGGGHIRWENEFWGKIKADWDVLKRKNMLRNVQKFLY